MTGEEEEGQKKTYEFYLILNWKTGDVKVRKTEPKKSKLAASDIPIHQKVDVIIPEEPRYEAKGTIEISREKMEDMIIEEL